jgi:chaperone BCS1
LFSLSNNGLNDTILSTALRISPINSIIVIEDIDCVFPKREEDDEDDNKNPNKKFCYVSFSGVLNAIDGLGAQEGRIFIMTTNHPERLDPALLRPGRVDYKLEFSFASSEQVERMFSKFYPEEKDLARKFSEKIPEGTISTAQIQGHCLRFRTDPLGAYKACDQFIQMVEDEKNEIEDRKRKRREEREKKEKEKNAAKEGNATL